MSRQCSDKPFRPLKMAVLTVSDSRTAANDTSGDLLVERLNGAGHELADRRLERDDIYRLRAVVSAWIDDPGVECVLVTGGTGITGRDNTPEALEPLLDRDIPGFGELFRYYSLEEIGTSTIQSRAFAGTANATLIFGMPGSTGACATAWDRILGAQLDSRTQPCNFVSLIPRLDER
ncbi:molybdenum cofactor biosynthesis protein B [Salinisphaera sp. PC39]|uniref:molybdenum cofactor biosynthesis protein B n=1 Tax=Salinisphaera sp. PC39 TaxID=1304156 RepID=UPI003342443C